MVCYYKVRQLFYYNMRQVLLQSATGITKCDDYYKVRQYIRISIRTAKFLRLLRLCLIMAYVKAVLASA